MIIQYFFFTYLLTIFVTFLIYKFAMFFKITDKPNHRKMHKSPKALLGGLALYISILLIYLVYLKFDVDNTIIITWTLAFCMVILGIYDDIFDMNPFVKFGFQIIIVYFSARYLGGVNKIDILGYAITFSQFQAKIITMVWILLLVNSFNLIDGLDGLSAGAGIISLTTLLVSMLIVGDTSQIVLFLIIIGALFGILHYNFYPSIIFLGDSGAMFIGYMIAVLSINEYKAITISSFTLIFLMVFLPLLDVCLAILRRRINGEKFYKPDALHFHHRLMRHGNTHQKSVLIMYKIMCIYAVLGIGIGFSNGILFYIIIGCFIGYTLFIIDHYYLLSTRYSISYRIMKLFKGG